MKALMPSFLRRLTMGVAVVGALAGCSTLEVNRKTIEQTQVARKGPQTAPFRSITGFTSALRCMDDKMIDFGVRDVTMLVEDILDQTKKVNAGTRDMLISAVSDMTRRSRAIRINAFGRDATNMISFLATAQRQQAYEVVPQYDIKGSISQFDENVIRNQKDLGIGYQPFINLGISRDAASSILGLDLSVLTTDDMTILPGVTSRNSVAILKQGKGLDADAAYHKFGVSYTMSLSKSEGQSQALRGLVELAVIELMGKLTKTPYWTCLGADPKGNEEISQEISDWYYAMSANRVELIGYFQYQMRRRGFYSGPIDGAFNPAIDQALANYRAALGLSKEAVIDQAFFTTFLNADHSKVQRPDKPAVLEAPANPAPLGLVVTTRNDQTSFARGEQISLIVKPSRDSHVYCYMLDENAKFVRFFPNRFAKDSFVSAASPLSLPGKMRFQIAMYGKGAKETISCFATPRDVIADLPANVVGVDFQPLPVTSMQQIRAAFVNASGASLAEENFHVQSK